MELPIFQVDAFTNKVFGGNPAAIVPLEKWLPDATLQSIALENNLAETAYFVKVSDDCYHLRWFTPAIEMDLCGHATLASAFVVLSLRREFLGDVVTFHTKSGALKVQKDGERYSMDFPMALPAIL